MWFNTQYANAEAAMFISINISTVILQHKIQSNRFQLISFKSSPGYWFLSQITEWQKKTKTVKPWSCLCLSFLWVETLFSPIPLQKQTSHSRSWSPWRRQMLGQKMDVEALEEEPEQTFITVPSCPPITINYHSIWRSG